IISALMRHLGSMSLVVQNERLLLMGHPDRDDNDLLSSTDEDDNNPNHCNRNNGSRRSSRNSSSSSQNEKKLNLTEKYFTKITGEQSYNKKIKSHGNSAKIKNNNNAATSIYQPPVAEAMTYSGTESTSDNDSKSKSDS